MAKLTREQLEYCDMTIMECLSEALTVYRCTREVAA